MYMKDPLGIVLSAEDLRESFYGPQVRRGNERSAHDEDSRINR